MLNVNQYIIIKLVNADKDGTFNHYCINLDKHINAMCAASINQSVVWKCADGEVRPVTAEAPDLVSSI